MNHTTGKAATAMISAEVLVPRRSALSRVIWSVDSGAHHERADDGCQNADGGDQQRHGKGTNALHVGNAVEGNHAQGAGGDQGANIGLIQVGAHAGHVAHVVAHIVRDGGGVPGVVLGNARLHLAHKVGAHVSGLGENTAAHTGEQSHGAGAHTKGQHGRGDLIQRKPEHIPQQQIPAGDVQ